MSTDTFSHVLDTALAERNDEVSFSFMDNSISGNTFVFVTRNLHTSCSQEISTDPAVLEMPQFDSPRVQFDFTSNSPFGCHPSDVGNRASGGEKSQGVHSIDQSPFKFTNADPTLIATND